MPFRFAPCALRYAFPRPAFTLHFSPFTFHEDTIERALKEMDYTYKRSAKGVSEKAPGKEEKKEAITRLIAEIMEFEKQHDCEIFALDESHFSTEPYLIRGWQKKVAARGYQHQPNGKNSHSLGV
jgi:hypothetical protein